jgi:hypothetical protein
MTNLFDKNAALRALHEAILHNGGSMVIHDSVWKIPFDNEMIHRFNDSKNNHIVLTACCCSWYTARNGYVDRHPNKLCKVHGEKQEHSIETFETKDCRNKQGTPIKKLAKNKK